MPKFALKEQRTSIGSVNYLGHLSEFIHLHSFQDLSEDRLDGRGSTPVNFTLKYNLMPYVGVLTFGEIGRTAEALPFPPAESSV